MKNIKKFLPIIILIFIIGCNNKDKIEKNLVKEESLESLPESFSEVEITKTDTPENNFIVKETEMPMPNNNDTQHKLANQECIANEENIFLMREKIEPMGQLSAGVQIVSIERFTGVEKTIFEDSEDFKVIWSNELVLTDHGPAWVSTDKGKTKILLFDEKTEQIIEIKTYDESLKTILLSGGKDYLVWVESNSNSNIYIYNLVDHNITNLKDRSVEDATQYNGIEIFDESITYISKNDKSKYLVQYSLENGENAYKFKIPKGIEINYPFGNEKYFVWENFWKDSSERTIMIYDIQKNELMKLKFDDKLKSESYFSYHLLDDILYINFRKMIYAIDLNKKTYEEVIEHDINNIFSYGKVTYENVLQTDIKSLNEYTLFEISK